MLSAELIAKIKALDLRAKFTATDMMAGEYASAFHGRGMEFHEVREYVPGDEVRGIDWNVTARMGQPYVKVFREERELTVMLIIDISQSLESGRLRPGKDMAAEFASILTWLAMKNNDRVGLLLFSSVVEHYVPPRKGKGHAMRILGDILSWTPRYPGTDFAAPLDHLCRILKRRSVCFLVSDFMGHVPPGSLRRLAGKHDLTCVSIQGAQSRPVVDAGVILVKDRESGETRELDTSSILYKRQVASNSEKSKSRFKKLLTDSGASSLVMDDGQDMAARLAEYLRGHNQRRGG